MKLMWKKWLGVSLIAAFGISAAPAWSRDLVMAEAHPPAHPIVKSEELLVNRLAELTNGELRIQLKHSGQLGNEDSAWKNVRNASLDMTRINFATLANDVPAATLLGLPYLFRSRDHMWNVLGADFGKRIESEVKKTGAVVLSYYDSGSRSFYSNKKPIRVRSDFVGQRIRVQGSPVYKDLITLLGGIPVVLPYDKVIDAFKNGEIDAAENNIPSYVSSDHYKYARFYSFDEHSSVPEVLLMSKKAWDSLSPAHQKAVMTAAAESNAYMKKLWAEAEVQGLAKAKKEGCVILEKHQLGMSGIEAFAIKLYSKYVTDPVDLETVLTIMRSE
jgi:TRAP-type transport system periplasmic protein